MRPTRDNFWASFTDALAKHGEQRPTGKGWIPLDEWVKRAGMNRTNVSAKLMAGVRLGVVERFHGMLLKNGRLRKAAWYRRVGKTD